MVMTYYGHVEQGHGKHGRIGILYNPADHHIVEVYKGSPAEEVGLKRGDVVVFINDADITGPAYTLLNLTIRRGQAIFTVIVERVPSEQIDVRHPLPHENK